MMVSSDHSISTLLIRAGLPDFPIDDSGFPQPGPVIRYFREHMEYFDPFDQKKKKWRQTDLAIRLGVSEVTVRLMETKNNSLDSITRRRVLADILKIPPALLGLGSLDELRNVLNHYGEPDGTGAIGLLSVKAERGDNDVLLLYKNALQLHWSMHYTGMNQGEISEVKQWATRIEADAGRGKTDQKAIEEVLCGYYQLLAIIHGDRCMYGDAAGYLDNALELATTHDNNQLKASIFYRYGHVRLDQRKFGLARLALDSALEHVRYAPAPLQGVIFQTTGLAYALTAQSGTDTTKSLTLLDKAEKIASDDNREEDNHFVKFSFGRYCLERADALIAMNRSASALKQLDKADEEIAPDQKRRRAYIDILRAEASMHLKTPRLDNATAHLADALNTSIEANSKYNIKYIERLYTDLSKSTYGKSLEVADLGLALRNWKK